MTDYTLRSRLAKLIRKADLGRDTEIAWLAVERSLTTISWCPDGSGDAETWADVIAILEARKAPMDILIRADLFGGELEITPGYHELYFSRFVSPMVGNPSLNKVVIQDGAVLHNLGSTAGALVLVSRSSAPCLELDALPGGPPVYVANFGSVWAVEGTAPMIYVPDGEIVVLASASGGFADGVAGQPIVAGGAGSILIVVFTGILQQAYSEFIGGPATSLCVLRHEGQIPFPIPLPLFNGTLINAPLGSVGGSGGTAFRPASFQLPLSIGCTYFDSDLVPPMPIWWTGTQWVDATGSGPV